MSTHKPQSVTFWPAVALVVTNMIGTGVFLSLHYQVMAFSTPYVFPILALWITGGILAVCGALCYAELATALPQSGGEYHFLSRIYHPSIGFCAGLCSVLVGFAAPCAVNADLFGSYFSKAFPEVISAAPRWGEHLVAIVLVIGLTFAHLRSLRFTGFLQSSAMFISISLIALFIFAGFIFCSRQPIHFLPQLGSPTEKSDGAILLGSAFWSNLIYVMYAYTGWNAATYIVGEVENPGKTLPRALIFGTISVMVIYVTLNAVFLYTTPISEIAGNEALLDPVGEHILGSKIGARFVSLLMCIGLAANVSAMVWIGSRVSHAVGSQYRVLSILGLTTQTRVPWSALLVQLGIILSLLLVFDAKSILNYVSFVLLLCSTLTVLGVIVLRFTEPGLYRPYRTFAYPITPLLFMAISIWCLYSTFLGSMTESILGTATTLVGIPIYFAAKALQARPTPQQAELTEVS